MRILMYIVVQEDGGTEGRVQRYSQAPLKLQQALAVFLNMKVSLVLQLGDIINGGNSSQQAIYDDFKLIKDIFKSSQLPIAHTIGNHCLAVTRPVLIAELELPATYYTLQLGSGWRIVVLDTTQMSGHSGLEADHPAELESKAFLESHPLSERHPQMAFWNGGIPSTQSEWLKAELSAAERAGEHVIVAAHHQIGKGAARESHLAWNHESIASILESSRSTALVLAGHDHVGGYACRNGVHYVTVQAILEAPTDSNAYGVLELGDGIITLRGFGTVPNKELCTRTVKC